MSSKVKSPGKESSRERRTKSDGEGSTHAEGSLSHSPTPDVCEGSTHTEGSLSHSPTPDVCDATVTCKDSVVTPFSETVEPVLSLPPDTALPMIPVNVDEIPLSSRPSLTESDVAHSTNPADCETYPSHSTTNVCVMSSQSLKIPSVDAQEVTKSSTKQCSRKSSTRSELQSSRVYPKGVPLEVSSRGKTLKKPQKVVQPAEGYLAGVAESLSTKSKRPGASVIPSRRSMPPCKVPVTSAPPSHRPATVTISSNRGTASGALLSKGSGIDTQRGTAPAGTSSQRGAAPTMAASQRGVVPTGVSSQRGAVPTRASRRASLPTRPSFHRHAACLSSQKGSPVSSQSTGSTVVATRKGMVSERSSMADKLPALTQKGSVTRESCSKGVFPRIGKAEKIKTTDVRASSKIRSATSSYDSKPLKSVAKPGQVSSQTEKQKEKICKRSGISQKGVKSQSCSSKGTSSYESQTLQEVSKSEIIADGTTASTSYAVVCTASSSSHFSESISSNLEYAASSSSQSSESSTHYPGPTPESFVPSVYLSPGKNLPSESSTPESVVSSGTFVPVLADETVMQYQSTKLTCGTPSRDEETYVQAQIFPFLGLKESWEGINGGTTFKIPLIRKIERPIKCGPVNEPKDCCSQVFYGLAKRIVEVTVSILEFCMPVDEYLYDDGIVVKHNYYILEEMDSLVEEDHDRRRVLMYAVEPCKRYARFLKLFIPFYLTNFNTTGLTFTHPAPLVVIMKYSPINYFHSYVDTDEIIMQCIKRFCLDVKEIHFESRMSDPCRVSEETMFNMFFGNHDRMFVLGKIGEPDNIAMSFQHLRKLRLSFPSIKYDELIFCLKYFYSHVELEFAKSINYPSKSLTLLKDCLDLPPYLSGKEENVWSTVEFEVQTDVFRIDEKDIEFESLFPKIRNIHFIYFMNVLTPNHKSQFQDMLRLCHCRHVALRLPIIDQLVKGKVYWTELFEGVGSSLSEVHIDMKAKLHVKELSQVLNGCPNLETLSVSVADFIPVDQSEQLELGKMKRLKYLSLGASDWEIFDYVTSEPVISLIIDKTEGLEVLELDGINSSIFDALVANGSLEKVSVVIMSPSSPLEAFRESVKSLSKYLILKFYYIHGEDYSNFKHSFIRSRIRIEYCEGRQIGLQNPYCERK
ncbi:serine-rich adhesin for platelets-like isoform X2 [Macrobrachium nipponense]|uniref:serine-rich adhesin for platelets-like isoform X2 n=1 Tax=Macrobrachium nipponense TaxID=159736 RepID=UPI0030C7B596